MDQCNKVCNPVVPGCRLTKYENGRPIDATKFKQLVGSLMYMLAITLELAYSVCLIATYVERLTEIHLSAGKRILKYLKGYAHLGILYKKAYIMVLQGWTDSNYTRDNNDRKSIIVYVFQLGSGSMSWSLKNQPIVTPSTTEAEFLVAASCACPEMWLRSFLHQIKQTQR